MSDTLSGLSTRDSSTLKELASELDSVGAGAGVLDTVLDTLRRLLGSENALLMKMRQNGRTWDVEMCQCSGLSKRAELERRYRDFVRAGPHKFAWYDAGALGPDQCNRVVEALSLMAPGEYEASRLRSEVMAPLKLERHRQLRALLCDGPSLLAWFGAFIPGTVDERQFRILNALVPAMRRRLMLERRLNEAPRLSSALEATLEHLGAPAFVLGPAGQIRETNAAARALLVRSHSGITASLREVVAGRTTSLACEVTPLRDRAQTVGWLVIVGPASARGTEAIHTRASLAAKRWLLSPRRAQVLGLVALGYTNLRIAAELGISERTVEDHVAAILARAQAGNRAELIAAILT